MGYGQTSSRGCGLGVGRSIRLVRASALGRSADIEGDRSRDAGEFCIVESGFLQVFEALGMGELRAERPDTETADARSNDRDLAIQLFADWPIQTAPIIGIRTGVPAR
jgi:hypothetical protein